jgi:hypothetical protein
MSKTVTGVISLLAIIIIGGAWYLKSNNTESVVYNIETEQAILLYVESGDVSYKRPGSAEFRQATTSPIEIANQTVVKTGVGRASVLLPDNSNIALDQNTEITINYTKSKTSIYQTLGTTYHRVETLLTGGTYQVQTPGTLAAVRGTKFAVKYDAKTKKSKVAVTEHKVEVSTIPVGSQVTGTTTPPIETMTLEEGSTVTVDVVLKVPTKGESAFKRIETSKDPEMKVWIDANAKSDIDLERIKSDIQIRNNTTEIRREIKRVLFDDEVSNNNQDTEIKTETQESTETLRTETTTTVKPSTTVTTPPTTTSTTIPVIKKIDEEQFFNTFNDMFIKYFYLDDVDTACEARIVPAERVRLVTTYATQSGYPFSSNTLLSFAQAIDAYCSQKDASVKIKLQGRFDEEFPFSEDI